MSLTAYQQAAARAESPRETEYRLFGMVVRALVQVSGLGRSNLGALASVIDWNKQSGRPWRRTAPMTATALMSPCAPASSPWRFLSSGIRFR